jgi:hypothetical protein
LGAVHEVIAGENHNPHRALEGKPSEETHAEQIEVSLRQIGAWDAESMARHTAAQAAHRNKVRPIGS